MSETEKAIYRLVLHPQDANCIPESTEIVRLALQAAEFIGEIHLETGVEDKSGNAAQDFLVGERFLQLLTFMGCSPNINLEPQYHGDHDFCHIRMSPLLAQPQFRSHERDVFARCPECGRRDNDWRARLEDWQVNSSQINYQCPHCHQSMSLYDLRWRQQAGFARFFIDVFSIFPQEAIPTDNLLGVLNKTCAQPWNYFFTNR
ncbi:hypothetical protein MNBD_GAMMA25-2143 [hydrothermal vent metagenome]|uniref:Uncharacterized protein n=1 Tax=hydrothermal vent metagenome TaxID=652676 RepID=A0A3B1C4A0_9ZZZZ